MNNRRHADATFAFPARSCQHRPRCSKIHETRRVIPRGVRNGLPEPNIGAALHLHSVPMLRLHLPPSHARLVHAGLRTELLHQNHESITSDRSYRHYEQSLAAHFSEPLHRCHLDRRSGDRQPCCCYTPPTQLLRPCAHLVHRRQGVRSGDRQRYHFWSHPTHLPPPTAYQHRRCQVGRSMLRLPFHFWSHPTHLPPPTAYQHRRCQVGRSMLRLPFHFRFRPVNLPLPAASPHRRLRGNP